MCAQARTVWCLVDVTTRRPRRVEPWMVEMFTRPTAS